MKNHMRKVLSSVLLLSLILSQSSSLIYSIKASSEYVSDITSEEDVSVDSETIEIENSQSEQAISEETTTSEEGIISKVVNSFKSDRSLASATNGAATVEIVGYDESTGMSQNTIYDVKVTADFGSDITSSGKTLEFTLPDGMIFKQIPVVTGAYNTTGVDTTILAAMGSDDPLTGATTNITLPTKEGVTNSTFGTVKYEFNEGTKGVGITFKVQLDYRKVYSAHTLPDAMFAIVSMAGTQTGEVDQTIVANVDARQPIYTRYTGMTSSEILTSNATEQYTGYTYSSYFSSNTNIAAKNIVAYIYYPQGSTYVGLTHTLPAFDVENDAANSRVKLTLKNPYAVLGLEETMSTYVMYQFPEGTTPGVYTNPQENYIEFEAYNGDKYTIVENNVLYKVKVVDQKVNAISIKSVLTYAEDNSNPGITSGGVQWTIRNEKAYTIDDQIVHISADDTLKTNVIVFPYDIDANNGTKVSKVMYKTHQSDTWITLDQSQLDTINYPNKVFGIIELTDIGLATSDTLSEIKIWTGSYSAGYNGEGQLGGAGGMVRNLISADIIAPALSGNINYAQYSETDMANTTSNINAIIRDSENDSEMKATSHAYSLFYDEAGNAISNLVAGDTLVLKGYFTSYAYFETSRNLQTIVDPVLYIRETDEYKIDINNLKLTYLGSEVDYTYEKQEDVNGNVVYKVMTSPDIIVGPMFNSDSNNYQGLKLNFEIKIITDPLATNDITNNDVVIYNSNKYDVTGVRYTDTTNSVVDTYDMDGDGSTTDTVMANNPQTILMKPNTNIIVQSAFSKDGTDDNVEYINGDDSTAAVLEPGETYEYIATVINNAGESVDEFTAIIPVPKTGDNFGSFFQDEAFTWTMTLASLPTAPDGFEFYYSTDVTASTVLNGATWTKTPKNLDDVKMIKMVSTHTIVAGETVEVRVPYTIGETYDSTISGNKAGNVNAFKVAYEQKTSSYNGVLSGTWAGATYILAPEIELEDLNYIIGNSADLEEKVVATDFYGEQIGMTDITYDGSNVPVVDGLYSEVGTYQVEYTATDRNGLTVTGTRLIKIDGLPEVEAEDQVYYITESDIEGQVDDAGVGYANRAGSEVGSALIKEEIGTTYEILSYSETLTEESSEVGSETSSEVDSEVSSEEDSETTEVETLAFAAASETVVDQTFDKVGYYDVKYTAVDSFGQVAEKTVLVTVLDVEETPSEPTEEPSESKSDKLSDMTIADTGVNLVGTIIATLAILISLILIKRNLLIKQ